MTVIEDLTDTASRLNDDNIVLQNLAGPLKTSDTMASVAFEFSIYFIGFYSAFSALKSVFMNTTFREKWVITRANALDFACKSVSAMFAIMATLTGIYILTTSDHNERKTSHEFLVGRVLVVAVSYFLYDVYAMYEVYLAKDRPVGSKTTNEVTITSNDQQTLESTSASSHNAVLVNSKEKNFITFLHDNPLMAAHHLVIALIFTPLIALSRNHEPGDLMIAAALVMEASTPFVSLRSVLSDLHLKSSVLYVVNGLTMVFVFFWCRIAVYAIFYSIYGSLRNMTAIGAMWNTPWHCKIFTLMTLLPQLYWFRIMVRGAFKVVADTFSSKQETKELRPNSTKIKSN